MPPTNLAIFDIDGTLLDNLAVEDECFSAALYECLGLDDLDTEWSHYQHVSDHGVTCEAFARRFGCVPTDQQLETTITRFVDLLGVAHRNLRMKPIGGAHEFLSVLGSAGWAVALATGAWRRAAEFKLSAGGIAWAELPLSSSEDGPARVDIVSAARQRAEQLHATHFERVVMLGDGVWDVRTARDLALPFVGIGTGARAARLGAAGADTLLGDYVDATAALRALESARAPAG